MADYRKHLIGHTASEHLSGGADAEQFATCVTGAKATGNLASWDASDDLQDSGVASSAIGKVSVAKAGSLVGTRGRINFIEGTNVTLTVTDDSGSDEVDVTVASTGGGGGAPTNYPTNVPFVDSGFSWTNQTTGTGTSTDGDIFIVSRTNVLTNDLSLYLQAVPSTPYKLWTRFLFRGRQNNTDELGGICWYDSGSGALMFFGLRANNNLVLYGATKVTPTPTYTLYHDGFLPIYGIGSGAFGFGLEDDGTNKDAVLCPTLQYSRIFRRFTHTEYITPTHIGLWVANGAGSGEAYLEVLSYDYY